MTTQPTQAHIPPAYEALIRLYTTRAAVERMVQLHLNQTLDQITTSQEGLSIVLFRLVQWAHAHGKFPELVRAVWLDTNGAREWADVFGPFLRASPPSMLSAANPEDDWLLGEDVFINRADLRQKLRGLRPGAGKRVLIVRGERYTGKSYTLRLIQHVAQVRREQVACIDVADTFGTTGTPGDFAVTLLRNLNLPHKDVPERDPQNPNRWPKELCPFLIGRLRSLQDPWWIVLDGCARAKLGAELWATIIQLCAEIQANLQQLRVALLDFDEAVQPPLKRHARIEQIARINAEHVRNLFLTALAGQGHVTEQRLDEEIDAVFEGIDVTSTDPAEEEEPPLARVGARVCEALERLRRPLPPGPPTVPQNGDAS